MNSPAASISELKQLKGITFVALNICSVTRKIDDIKLLLHRSNLDYLSMNESWLSNSIHNAELNIDNYRFHHFYRDSGSGKCGGGELLTYFNCKYNFEILDDWNLCCPDLE